MRSKHRWGLYKISAVSLAAALAVWGGSLSLSRLEAHVSKDLAASADAEPTITFVDLPASLRPIALADLQYSIREFKAWPWTQDNLCKDMAQHLEQVGWIRQLHYVRRTADAHFEVSATYRIPVVMVQKNTFYYLIDNQAVRLPGTYTYDEHWLLLQGVGNSAPPAGSLWMGQDLQAGLAMLRVIDAEPYFSQLSAILVDNFEGRADSRRPHLALATDRPSGRIYWGSAPGQEIEENSVAQKLAILRANYVTTGRADAGHTTIDVSTYSDRYTVPG